VSSAPATTRVGQPIAPGQRLPTDAAKHPALAKLTRWPVTVEDVMKKDHIAITDTTSLKDAVHLMDEHRLLSLPVERNGEVLYTVTRHDLLRAWVGLGLGIEDGNE